MYFANQGVATIFGCREHTDRGVGFRLGPIAYLWVRSRPLASIRLALGALTTPKSIDMTVIPASADYCVESFGEWFAHPK